jgi:site-specific recombinase XerD
LLGHNSLRTTSIYFHVQDVSNLKIKSPFDTLQSQANEQI